MYMLDISTLNMLLIDTCYLLVNIWHLFISLDNWCVLTPDMLLLNTCFLLWHDYHLPLVILILDRDYHIYGNPAMLSCIIYSDMYSCYTCTHILLNSWSCPAIPVIDNYLINSNKIICTRFEGNWWVLNSHVYGGLIESSVATYLRDHLATTRDSVGCAGTPTPDYSCRVCSPRPISMGSAILYSCSGVHKTRYLAVRSGSAPDTPEPLSRACTGPIQSMIHRTLSVSKQLAL